MSTITTDLPATVAGLQCAACKSARVTLAPADGISPHPGYRCLECGARMRGMTFQFVLAILLGIGLLAVASGLVPIFGDERDPRIVSLVRSPVGPWSAVFTIPLYLLGIGCFARQLIRPSPGRSAPGV